MCVTTQHKNWYALKNETRKLVTDKTANGTCKFRGEMPRIVLFNLTLLQGNEGPFARALGCYD